MSIRVPMKNVLPYVIEATHGNVLIYANNATHENFIMPMRLPMMSAIFEHFDHYSNGING